MSDPRRMACCPGRASASTSTCSPESSHAGAGQSALPGRPVSSTITTASAPSGIGAPVAISTQSPGASVPANGSAV